MKRSHINDMLTVNYMEELLKAKDNIKATPTTCMHAVFMKELV